MDQPTTLTVAEVISKLQALDKPGARVTVLEMIDSDREREFTVDRIRTNGKDVFLHATEIGVW